MSERQRDCRRAETLLARLLDGELEPQDEHWLRIHLGECCDCRQELWALRLGRRAGELLSPAEGYESALAERRAEALSRTEEQMRRERAHPVLQRWWWAPVAAAALVVAMLFHWQASPPVRAPAVAVEPASLPHVEQPPVTIAQPDEVEFEAKEREVTEVRLFWDGVQIVWVFDSDFRP